MLEYDAGPPKAFAKIFADAPDYQVYKDHFWYDWGPIFYRGRLDGTARLLCVASDPGPTERVACRALVGDAGQRVQGFLTKIGLTRSYVCLNAFIYALHPSHSEEGTQILRDPDLMKWRNKLFNKVKTNKIKAVVAFGKFAQEAVSLWPGKGTLPVFNTYHPSYRNDERLLKAWREIVTELRSIVKPDPDGNPNIKNYGKKFTDRDYSRIPYRDLPFGFPAWFGDDSWGRKATPRHNNCVKRPVPDDRHTLRWIAPKT